MLTYKDYCDFLESKDLLEASTKRQLWYWTCFYTAHLFECLQPKAILEIGRNCGHSTGLFRFLAPASRIISVDPVDRLIAHKVIDACTDKATNPGTNNIINGTIDDVDHATYDFVLIDGDHGYKAVKYDWYMVSKHFMHDNSVVIFDNLNIPAVNKVFHTLVKAPYIKEEPMAVPQGPEKGTFGVVYGKEAKKNLR